MKLTNGQVLATRQPLATLIAAKFPVRVSYNLAKLAQKLNGQMKIIEDVRNELVKKWGEKNERGQVSIPQFVDKKDAEGKPVLDEKGKPVQEPNPGIAKFSEEFAQLLEEEVELDIKEKVKLPEKVACACDKCHNNMDRPLEIEPNILMALDLFIEI